MFLSQTDTLRSSCFCTRQGHCTHTGARCCKIQGPGVYCALLRSLLGVPFRSPCSSSGEGQWHQLNYNYRVNRKQEWKYYIKMIPDGGVSYELLVCVHVCAFPCSLCVYMNHSCYSNGQIQDISWPPGSFCNGVKSAFQTAARGEPSLSQFPHLLLGRWTDISAFLCAYAPLVSAAALVLQ